MNYDIKRGSTVVATITPTGSQKRALMGQDTLNCSFTLNSFVQFAIGDTIQAFNATYVLNKYPQVEKVSSLQYDYNATFEAQGYDLAKVQYLFPDPAGSYTVPDFPLTGDAGRFIDLIVSNMNRASSGWSKGTVDTTDYTNISFSEDSCLAALSKIAQQFQTEFWIDGKVINMTKRGQLTTLNFQYGKNNGLYSIQRAPSNDKDVFSRLYVFGSTKNLPSHYRGGQLRLQLPGSDPFIQKSQQFNDYGLIETTQIFDGSNNTKEIYPHRTGIISAVGDTFAFTDSGMDFDVNAQLLPGVEALVHFQTGQLAGYEFTINSYNAGTKTFVINPFKSDSGMVLPESSGLKPAVGDTYVLLQIEMPASYVTAAENELQTAGDDYYDTNSNGREVYNVDCDPLYFKSQNLDTLNIGDFVTISEASMSISRSIRMIEIDRDLQAIFKYSVTLADTASIATIVREYFDQQSTKIIIQQNKLNDVARARRNWRNIADLEDMVFDPEGDYYTDKIKPGSIETLYLAVGAKAQNYSLNGVVIQPNYQGDQNNLQISSGQLVHYTLEIKGIGSIWQMVSGSFTGLDPNTSYYLFARISTTSLTGTWKLLTAPVTVDSETGYYNLGVGILFKAKDGYRDFEFNKGMTYIVGDTITTGVIKSLDAQNYFDLTQGKFNLGSATSGLDWDVTRPDTLTLRGTLVQNAGGNTSEIGVYRGTFDPLATYYKGDTVVYNNSTWKFISDTPKSGSTPSGTNIDWQVSAMAGANAVRVIYAVSDDPNTPPDLNITDPNPAGWTVGVPGADILKLLGADDGQSIVTDTGLEIIISAQGKFVWMATETLNPDGTFLIWTDPSRLTGREGVAGQYTDIRWAKNGSETVPPAVDKTNPDPAGWSIVQPELDVAEYLWMIQAQKLGNGILTTLWSDPVRMQGKDGDNGPAINYRGEYSDETNENLVPSLGQSGRYSETDGTLIPSDDWLSTWLWDAGEWQQYTVSGVAALATSAYRFVFTDENNVFISAVISNGLDHQTVITPAGTQYLKINIANATGVGTTPSAYPNVRLETGPDVNGKTSYHGDKKWVDVVHYAATGLYYYARTDAGDFSSILPTDTTKWNVFGAQFSSIATGLLFAKSAYVGKLIVKVLSSDYDPKNPKPRIYAQDGEIDIFNSDVPYGNETTDKAMIRIGKSAGIMNQTTSEGPKPGMAIRDLESDDSYTEVSSEGVFSNGSGMMFLPSSSGLKTNAGVASLLTKRNDSATGVSAAVVGVDQTSGTDGASQSWGGYFNTLFAGLITTTGLNLTPIIGNGSNIDLATTKGVYILANNNSVITITFPATPAPGELHIIERNGNGGVQLDGNGNLCMAGIVQTGIYSISTVGKVVIAVWNTFFWKLMEIG